MTPETVEETGTTKSEMQKKIINAQIIQKKNSFLFSPTIRARQPISDDFLSSKFGPLLNLRRQKNALPSSSPSGARQESIFRSSIVNGEGLAGEGKGCRQEKKERWMAVCKVLSGARVNI